MKKILIIASVLLLVACQSTSTSDVEKIGEKINYFKDSKTGLCFATINSNTYSGYEVSSFTCVPCEALANVNVTLLTETKVGGK